MLHPQLGIDKMTAGGTSNTSCIANLCGGIVTFAECGSVTGPGSVSWEKNPGDTLRAVFPLSKTPPSAMLLFPSSYSLPQCNQQIPLSPVPPSPDGRPCFPSKPRARPPSASQCRCHRRRRRRWPAVGNAERRPTAACPQLRSTLQAPVPPRGGGCCCRFRGRVRPRFGRARFRRPFLGVDVNIMPLVVGESGGGSNHRGEFCWWKFPRPVTGEVVFGPRNRRDLVGRRLKCAVGRLTPQLMAHEKMGLLRNIFSAYFLSAVFPLESLRRDAERAEFPFFGAREATTSGSRRYSLSLPPSPIPVKHSSLASSCPRYLAGVRLRYDCLHFWHSLSALTAASNASYVDFSHITDFRFVCMCVCALRLGGASSLLLPASISASIARPGGGHRGRERGRQSSRPFRTLLSL